MAIFLSTNTKYGPSLCLHFDTSPLRCRIEAHSKEHFPPYSMSRQTDGFPRSHSQVWFGRFGLVCYSRFGRFGLVCYSRFGRFAVSVDLSNLNPTSLEQFQTRFIQMCTDKWVHSGVICFTLRLCSCSLLSMSGKV